MRKLTYPELKAYVRNHVPKAYIYTKPKVVFPVINKFNEMLEYVINASAGIYVIMKNFTIISYSEIGLDTFVVVTDLAMNDDEVFMNSMFSNTSKDDCKLFIRGYVGIYPNGNFIIVEDNIINDNFIIATNIFYIAKALEDIGNLPIFYSPTVLKDEIVSYVNELIGKKSDTIPIIPTNKLDEYLVFDMVCSYDEIFKV